MAISFTCAGVTEPTFFLFGSPEPFSALAAFARRTEVGGGLTTNVNDLSEKTVMMKHVMRNAMIPILTNLAIYLPGVFVGSFLLEVFFSIPGLGREVVTAVNRSDFPVIKAVTVYLAIITMVINLLVDVMYKFVDPRVSFK